MKHLNTLLLLTAVTYHSIQCMEQPTASHLFVRTSDAQITPINKKNIPHMYVLNVMAAHQHKDFAFITRKKRKKNSYKNPLNASAITGLTSIGLQLLDKALDEHENEEKFYNFYSNLNYNKHAAFLDTAEKVQLDTALRINTEKIISLAKLYVPKEIEATITSYVIPKLPSVAALKKAILRKTSPIISELEGHINSNGKVLWNPDNSIFVFAHFNQLIICDGHTGKPITKFHNTYAQDITFSPNGTRLCYTTRYNFTKTYLRDGHTGKRIKTFTENIGAFSPDSKLICTHEYDPWHDKNNIEFIMIYNAETGDLIQTLKHDSIINNVIFTPDSKHIVSYGKGPENKKIVLWNINGNKVKFLKGHDDNNVTHVVFSPDYSRLVTGSLRYLSNDRTLILRKGKTGDTITTLDGHERDIAILLFSPNNKYLLYGAWDSALRRDIFHIWKAQTGRHVTTIHKEVNCNTDLVAFAQDNSFLIINDTLYDTQQFKPITTLSAHEKLSILALSPDGNCVAAQTNNQLVLYKLFTDEMLEIINGIKLGITDLLQAYKLTQLCKKFGVKIQKKTRLKKNRGTLLV